MSLKVDAFQYNGNLIGSDGKSYAPEWVQKAFEDGTMYYATQDVEPSAELVINVQGETVIAWAGDYIVRNGDGVIYPMASEIFEVFFKPLLDANAI